MEENKEEKVVMRKLKTMDIFALSRILKKMSIKDEIKALAKDITGMSDKEKKKSAQVLEIDLVTLFVENIGNAEEEVYKLFASLTAKTSEEIKNLDADKFIELIKELFSQEGFENFLSQASK